MAAHASSSAAASELCSPVSFAGPALPSPVMAAALELSTSQFSGAAARQDLLERICSARVGMALTRISVAKSLLVSATATAAISAAVEASKSLAAPEPLPAPGVPMRDSEDDGTSSG